MTPTTTKNDLTLSDLEEMFPNTPIPRPNKANDIITNIAQTLGTPAAAILQGYIRSYPSRAVYNFWLAPEHSKIARAAKLTTFKYYKWLNLLEEKGLIKKYYEKRFEKMLYMVEYEALEAYDPESDILGIGGLL